MLGRSGRDSLISTRVTFITEPPRKEGPLRLPHTGQQQCLQVSGGLGLCYEARGFTAVVKSKKLQWLLNSQGDSRPDSTLEVMSQTMWGLRFIMCMVCRTTQLATPSQGSVSRTADQPCLGSDA
jgi:hypothetical protein